MTVLPDWARDQIQQQHGEASLALVDRHVVLLERVAKLERALEEIDDLPLGASTSLARVIAYRALSD